MPYDVNGNWYEEAGGDGTNLFANQTNIPPNYGAYMPGTTNTGPNWAGAGQALTGALNTLGQFQQQRTAAQAPGVAAGQMVAGSEAGLGSVNALYGQTSALTTPFIQAGAGVGNAIQTATNPYIGAGQQAIGTLQGLQQPLNVNQFLDPSMAFTLKTGMEAAQRSQAARGGMLSGAALKDLTAYGSGLASQNYQNAVQNALANRTQQANIAGGLYQGGLQGVAAQTPIFQGGISALGVQGTNAANAMQQTAQLYQNIGQAQAGGTVQGSTGPSTLQQAGQAVQVGTQLYDLYDSIFSDADVKENVRDLSEKDVNRALNGMHAKTFDYKKSAQKNHGAPSSRYAGVMAQDVQKTPARGMVNNTSPLTLDIGKATSFSLAAVAALSKRLAKLEKGK